MYLGQVMNIVSSSQVHAFHFCSVLVFYPEIPDVFELDVPRYSLNLYDNYTTFDEQDLDVDCTQRYGTEFAVQAISMVDTVNGMISSGDLCPGQSGRMAASSALTTFISQGNWVCKRHIILD